MPPPSSRLCSCEWLAAARMPRHAGPSWHQLAPARAPAVAPSCARSCARSCALPSLLPTPIKECNRRQPCSQRQQLWLALLPHPDSTHHPSGSAPACTFHALPGPISGLSLHEAGALTGPAPKPLAVTAADCPGHAWPPQGSVCQRPHGHPAGCVGQPRRLPAAGCAAAGQQPPPGCGAEPGQGLGVEGEGLAGSST